MASVYKFGIRVSCVGGVRSVDLVLHIVTMIYLMYVCVCVCRIGNRSAITDSYHLAHAHTHTPAGKIGYIAHTHMLCGLHTYTHVCIMYIHTCACIHASHILLY